MTGRTRPLEAIPRLAELARVQCGVVSRAQLAACDVTRHHVRRQAEAQRWRLVGTRVVCLHTGGLSRQGQVWAAVLHAGHRSLIGGFTALELLGLRGWRREPVHVLVPMGVNVPPLAGLVVHRTRRWPDADAASRTAPRSTTAARSTIDAARWDTRPRVARGLVLAVVQQRRATADQLARCAAQLDWLRSSGAILDAVVEGSGGADSWAEVEVARLVHGAGLPRPRRQTVVDTLDGPRRVDLAVDLPDGSVLVVEVDGVHHLDADVRLADAAKDAAVIAAGNAVLRLPVAAVRRDPGRVNAQFVAIRRAAEQRQAARSSSGDSRNGS